MITKPRRDDQDAIQRDLVIGVDVGGTTVKAALFDSDGLEYVRSDRPTPRHLGPDAVITTTIDTIVELRAQIPEAARVRAVGLVVPGLVDAEQGIAVYAANIGWRQLPLRQIVAEAVGLPVILDHDVRAAGLAELELGAGRRLQEVLFVALGTGVAAAVITGGQVSAGATGRAGELGHLPVFPEGEWCACGQRGCTETYASATSPVPPICRGKWHRRRSRQRRHEPGCSRRPRGRPSLQGCDHCPGPGAGELRTTYGS